MKDVGMKPDSLRLAQATATLHAPAHCIELLRSGNTEKGDALKTARVAGILAAKRTDELIPLCHPLPIHRAEVTFELGDGHVVVTAEVQTIGPTGVEMEALTAASLAALTLYDMLKPYAEPEQLHIEACRLLQKKGGKSHYRRRLRAPKAAAIVVLSDTVARGDKPDTAGVAARQVLQDAGFDPIDYRLLADDATALGSVLAELTGAGVPLVLTVGGTGAGTRDITVDVVARMLTMELPGIMEAARAFGQQRMPFAMLSRGTAGYVGETLVATLPGSRGGTEQSLAAILPGLVHLLDDARAGHAHPGGYA
ncbi:bifunctional molybdenum cofactor biosynthesis protein MoaC/MoaB [Pinirhizobacter soli]|uniref:bifunctional molybdenum cofactor biosynthesis protein MoaC/MoaB n=1 Tax=Pinirhizobacter soli TaxID=2786953 RepID=UPI00202A041B|nr:bifunctional molybdenum cofactor biosynthesis protein MoaC/MoaB [Pinirhizobacter soli]